MSRRPLLLLIPLLAAACQAPGPDAEFRYRSNAAWVDAHPRAGEAGVRNESGESGVWSSPFADLRVQALPQGLRLHLHQGREEWLTVLDGHGVLRVGPVGAGLVGPAELQSYPLATGDTFLIPRSTAHAIQGSVTIQVLYSPPQPEDFDAVFPAAGAKH